jgi:hypothetical protein
MEVLGYIHNGSALTLGYRRQSGQFMFREHDITIRSRHRLHWERLLDETLLVYFHHGISGDLGVVWVETK